VPDDGLALATTGLVRRYGPDAGVLGVDLAVPRGVVYGLVGPNGAGKTTLLGLLSGLRRADQGQVRLGVDRTRLAVVSDVPEFERWLTAAEVVALAGSMAGVPAPRERVARELARVDLADVADRRVGGFSRGMTQRLALAVAAVGDPDLVLLDEPSSALDPAGRAAVLDLVVAWKERATVVLSSHVLADVQRVADIVGVLRAGRLVYQGPLQKLLDQAVQPSWLVRVRHAAPGLVPALSTAGWVRQVTDLGGGVVRVRAGGVADGERELVRVLAGAGAQVISIVPEEADLEAAFLALTGEAGAA
jgi:ABC-2 type transport system ATP-binding protein